LEVKDTLNTSHPQHLTISRTAVGLPDRCYQVCDKWLKDRKGRTLSLDEIQTYCGIVTAIQKSVQIQKSIDEIYEDLERALI